MALKYLDKVARMKPTAVSLENLFRYGRNASSDSLQRLRNAQFLHQELQIRIAQRIVELEQLPLGISNTGPVLDVIGWYTDYFDRMAEFSFPQSEDDEEDFTDLLRFVLQDNSAVIETMSRGVLEVRTSMKGFSVEDQRIVDKVLNRFYLARIGLRFLIEHHIVSREPQEGFAGIIQGSCRPLDYVYLAAEEATVLCEHNFGVSPKLQVNEIALKRRRSNTVQFTYVPSHLQYMLTEIFKNSFKAVTESSLNEGSIPPIKVDIVEGVEDVTIRISDQGGGIERSKLPLVWSYLHSTAKDPRIQQELLTDGRTRPILAGYGVGLPLSRLYSRYFGGDLDIKSLHGYGTDTFLHLPRLGNNCENLPEVVTKSPAESDSSLPRGNSQVFFFGDRKTWEENIHLGHSPAYHSMEDPPQQQLQPKTT